MEKRGVPTVTIVTDAMSTMAQKVAKDIGFDSLPIVTLPAPSDCMTEDQVQRAAESIVDKVVYILTEPAAKIEKEYKNKYGWQDRRKSETLVSMETCPLTVKT